MFEHNVSCKVNIKQELVKTILMCSNTMYYDSEQTEAQGDHSHVFIIGCTISTVVPLLHTLTMRGSDEASFVEFRPVV